MKQEHRDKFVGKLVVVLAMDVVSALSARVAYNSESLFLTVIAMLSLSIAGYFFIRLLNENITIVVNAIWIALGSINVTFASYIVFGEKLTSSQILGLVITITGLIILNTAKPMDGKSI